MPPRCERFPRAFVPVLCIFASSRTLLGRPCSVLFRRLSGSARCRACRDKRVLWGAFSANDFSARALIGVRVSGRLGI
jgi:hypothetical protein